MHSSCLDHPAKRCVADAFSFFSILVLVAATGCGNDCPKGTTAVGDSCIAVKESAEQPIGPSGEVTGAGTERDGAVPMTQRNTSKDVPVVSKPQPDTATGGAGGGRAAGSKPADPAPTDTAQGKASGNGGSAAMSDGGSAGPIPAGSGAMHDDGSARGPMAGTKPAKNDYAFANANKGTVIANPDIVLLFWGAYWGSAPKVSAGAIAGAVQDMAKGAYFAELNQYGVGLVELAWVNINTSAALPDAATFQQADVTQFISQSITAGTAPPLSPTGEQIYVVVLPPGYKVANAARAHAAMDSAGTRLRYAWVSDDGSWSGGASATRRIGQVLVGAMTDPEAPSGWMASGDMGEMLELAEVCGYTSTTAGGYAHAQYWSMRGGGCVVPRGYASLLRYDDAPDKWTKVWDEVHHAACGTWGLVASDTTDDVFRYDGTWKKIGPPAAAVVVGSTTVYSLSPDLSTISEYSGSGTSWKAIGQNAVNLFAGGFGLFATTIGSNDLLRKTDSEWQRFGGPGASFVVGASQVAGVPANHSSVWAATSSTSWTQQRTTGTGRLFGAGTSSQTFATDATSGDIYVFSSGTSWVRQGWSGYNFGFSNNHLFGLTPSRSGVFVSNDITAPSPDWTLVRGPTTRLVGGCSDTLYVTDGLVLCVDGNVEGATCAAVKTLAGG